MIAAGGFLFLTGLLTGVAGLAVPAAIIAGIGGILYWQVLHDDFASWAYLWTLIPGFSGVGAVLMALVSKEDRSSLGGGLQLILISLVLLAIFGTFLGGFSGLTRYWPVLLILYGVGLLVRMVFRRN
jgi:hypothetical protein